MENINANCNNAETNGLSPPPLGPKLCYGCKKPIEDDYRLSVSPDLEWHMDCLTCAECQQCLDESCTCFIKNGRPYCKTDYVRLFGVKCAGCLQPIAATDFVMKAKTQVYHINCFCCSTCEKQLAPGEQFGLSKTKLFCKSHYDALQFNDNISNMTTTNANNSTTSPSATSAPKTTPISSSTSTTSSSTTSSSSTSASAKRSNSEKGPRVRTVLSEQQLQTLRTVYASNPRPDALLKEQLVEITGLSPRVIRVWFQNKRCKDKKKAIQAEAARMHQQQAMQAGPGSSVIPPLTPQTPLTPDSMGQISPHPGMSAFTYPSAPNNYDGMQQIPTTPTQTAVSPIVTYQQNPVWASPTDTIAHFETSVDYSSPMTTEHQQQTFVYSTAATTTQGSYY